MLTFIHQCTKGFLRPDGHFFFVYYSFSLSVVYKWTVLGCQAKRNRNHGADCPKKKLLRLRKSSIFLQLNYSTKSR